jgi:hypothetical protein
MTISAPTKKTKAIILNISLNFLSYHPRRGEPTGFVDLVLDGVKKHTVRENYEYWRKRVEMVNSGTYVLKITCWSGRPYHSKKVEVKTITHCEIQKFRLVMRKRDKNFAVAYVDNRMLLPHEFTEFCKNDGLSTVDFIHWLRAEDFEGCVIHFGYFKY